MNRWLTTGLSAAVALAVGAALAVTMLPNSSASPVAPPPPPIPGALAAADADTHVAESDFVALSPCRLVNTQVQGGPVAAGKSRSFYVRGTANFPAQGGHSGGCGIPVAASAVSVVLHENSTQGTSYSHLYPAGGLATALLLN